MTRLTLLSQALQQSRRSFILRTASTVAFPLSLAACGGGGDDSSGAAGTGTGTDTGTGTGTGTGTTAPVVALTRSTAQGRVSLPAGASVKVVSVENAFGANVPAADGSFAFVSVAESEMYAVGLGPGGKMVLCGLLQSGSAVLSARSTAVCLAYTALGVGVYLPQTQVQYLAAIQASPTLAGLEAAVAAAIVARGEAWLDLNDAPLHAALVAMQAALAPTAMAMATAGGAAAQAGTQVAGAEKPASAGSVMLRGMAIDKTARTSGIQITGDGVGTITLTNFYRRRSYAYIERVSYRATFTGADIDSPAIVGVQPLKVDATKSITNTLVTLAQLYAGVNDFYDPVVYDAIATPIAPTGAALTTYRVTSLGLGVRAGDLALLTAEQRAGLRNVLAETFVLDIAVPIFCGILIPLRTATMRTFIETLALSRLRDVISALAAADDVFLNKIVAGNRPLNEVLWDTLLTLVNSDTLKNAFLSFFQAIIDSLSVAGTLPRTNVVNLGAQALLDAISAIDLTAQTMDLVAVGLSFAFSDLADRFTIDVTKSQVRLNPRDPHIDAAGLPTNFTLSVIDADLAVGDLSYRWNCTCLFGDVSDGTHLSVTDGTTFESSSSASLAYNPRGHGKGGDQDVVTGTVYRGSVIATRVPIGTATSTITYNTVVSPAAVQLLINTPQTFTADISTALLASGAALQYVWTVTGGGKVGGASVTTTNTPSVSYAAPALAGADTLTLSVNTATGTAISTGSAQITVLGAVAAGISPQNPRVPRSTVLNFVVSAAGGAFPTGTTFKWVLTHQPDLFGRAQDIGGSGGGAIGIGISPPASSGAPMGTSMTVVTTSPTITFAANPFGPESNGNTFVWNPSLILTVSALGAGGNVLATSSTPIQTQIPTSILLP